jgi:hypothetical protein
MGIIKSILDGFGAINRAASGKLPTIDAGGETRVLGHVPFRGHRNVSAHAPARVAVHRDLYRKFDLREMQGWSKAVPVENQNGRGACNAFAAAKTLMIRRFLDGMTPAALCEWFIYSILCQGRDVGSNIGEALIHLSKVGTCLKGIIPYGTINPRGFPQAAYDVAKLYRIEVGAPARTFAEMESLTQAGEPFNFSLRVGNNFNRLDSQGRPGKSRGPGNHAVTGGLGWELMPNGKAKILCLNSWDEEWGQDGYFWIDEEFVTIQSYFECYGVRAAIDLEGDPRNPPLIKAA